MTVVLCSGVLLMVSLFAMAQSYYFPFHPPAPAPTCFGSPSCRESIEDLKALMEVTHSMQDNNNYSCPTCASTFSEEIILKLINALIFTATYNCGYNGGSGGGYYPGGGNADGGLIGGRNTIDVSDSIIGGINTGAVNSGGTVGGIQPGGTGGGNTGGVKPGGTGAGNTGGVNTSGGNSSNNSNGLINVDVLGEDLLGIDIGATKVLGVDVGKTSGGGGSNGSSTTGPGDKNDDGLVQVGVLDKDNSLANVSVGETKLINVALGENDSNQGKSDVTNSTNAVTSQGGTTPPTGGLLGNTLPVGT